MRIWRRRKRERFTPFDRTALPEAEPLTFEESFAEGLLVSEAAGRMALKNRMELSLGIAIGSSLQIALFVAPMLVIVSHFIGPKPMDLVFTPAEVLAVFVAVLITGQIASDGESNWLEGVQLLAVYVILAMVFFFLPDAVETAP